MNRFKYDIKWMESELNRIGSPKRYRFPLKEIFENDYSIIVSIRQDAGKTTTALLYGLLLHRKYNTTIEYIRNDDTQIRRAKIETLFKTILRYDYISKIYNNRWNSIVYSYMQKKFFLCLSFHFKALLSVVTNLLYHIFYDKTAPTDSFFFQF